MYIKMINQDKENILLATDTGENWTRDFQLITGRSFGFRDGLMKFNFCEREYFNLRVIEKEGLFFKVQNDKEYLRYGENRAKRNAGHIALEIVNNYKDKINTAPARLKNLILEYAQEHKQYSEEIK